MFKLIFSKLAWFIPGGQIGAIISTVVDVIVRMIKALVDDVVDLFTSRRFVLAACLVIGGAWLSADWYRDKISDLKSDLAERTEQLQNAKTEITQWEGRLNDQSQRAADAAKARDEAEAQAKVEAEAVVARARAAAAKRVRDRTEPASAKAGPEKTPGPGVFGLPKLW